MTRPGSCFRPQFLVDCFVGVAVGCGGAELRRRPARGRWCRRARATSAPVVPAAAITDADPTFFVDRAPDLTPDLPPAAAAAPRRRHRRPMRPLRPTPRPADARRPAPPPPDTPPPHRRPTAAAAAAAPAAASAPSATAATSATATTADPNAVVVTSCEQIPCQELFVAAVACNGDDQACTVAASAQGDSVPDQLLPRQRRQEVSSTSVSHGQSLHDHHARDPRRRRALLHPRDGGQPLAATSRPMVWKSPAGARLAQRHLDARAPNRLIVSCRGVTLRRRARSAAPASTASPAPATAPRGLPELVS